MSAAVDLSYRQVTLDRANFGLGEMYNRLSTGRPTNIPIYPDQSYASHTGAATPFSPIADTQKFSGTRVDRDNNLQARISLKYDVPFVDGLSATASFQIWNHRLSGTR